MRRIITGMLLLVLISTLAGCGAPAPASEPVPVSPAPVQEPVPPPAPELESRVIKEWSGTGITTTESFTIDYAPWVVTWAHSPILVGGHSAGLLVIDVKTGPNDLGKTVVMSSAKEAGESYVHKKGTFFLDVNAANTNWVIKVVALVEKRE